ncbi:MAG: MarR family transcriptional regulator [Candidatus Hecatellales archaeon]|nr:MAG: MarR family transcriptional regulator [Candidatus Hecatellales archaeon]
MAKLENIFGSRRQTRLLEFLLQNPGKVFNQAGLARFLSCSPSTVARVIKPLVREGILAYEQVSGQMKILALNTESEKTRLLLEFYERYRRL